MNLRQMNKKPTGYKTWFYQNLDQLFYDYGEYVEAMRESCIEEMETQEEWLDEEWKIYQEDNNK